MPSVQEVRELLDWKRRIFALYARIRAAEDRERGWRSWRDEREHLFRSHPQSPIPAGRRAGLTSLPLYPYDRELHVLATMEPADGSVQALATSGTETFAFARVGTVRFDLLGEERSLDLFWLEAYGGGLFLPFADQTSGSETYGAGRYLLDTVKGADLGVDGDRLVLDFNLAYNPSCAYDPRWVCPLAPPGNRLDCRVEAGEKAPQPD